VLRRDVWLLPVISITTALVMLAGAELLTRIIWPEVLFNACRVSDPMTGHRYLPNCSSTMKSAEGPWYTSDYNECGYRSPAPCRPVATGTRRVAMIGTSLGEGYLVKFPETIAARLSAGLTSMCNSVIEVQNLSTLGATFHSQTLWMEEALKLRPDIILMMLAPYDFIVERGENIAQQNERSANENGDLIDRLSRKIKGSRALLIAKHFLFQNPSVFLPRYLRSGDWSDYLRPPFSPNWLTCLQLFDTMMAGLAAKAHGEGVPFVVGFVPFQAQLALLAGSPVPAGVDPAALPQAMEKITKNYGAAFLDVSVALMNEPDPLRQLYYVVDTHLSGHGQTLSGDYIAQRIAAEFASSFSGCTHTPSTLRAPLIF